MQLNKHLSPGVITLFIPQSPHPTSEEALKHTPCALQHANKPEAEDLLPSIRWDNERSAPTALLPTSSLEQAEGMGLGALELCPSEGEASPILQALLTGPVSQLLAGMSLHSLPPFKPLSVYEVL